MLRQAAGMLCIVMLRPMVTVISCLTTARANITEKRQISLEICRFSGGNREARTLDLTDVNRTL